MSDGLARVAGGGVPIRFDGEDVVLEPLVLKDLATIEQHLLAKRKNPLQMVQENLGNMQELDVEVQKHIIDRAYDDLKRQTTVSAQEVSEFIETTEGLAFTLWLCFGRSHPGRWKLDYIKEKIETMSMPDVMVMLRARDQASGLDEMGNSTGQSHEQPQTLAEKNGTARVQVSGVESPGKSAKPTDTRPRKSQV